MKDKIMAGLITGVLADLMKLLFNYICFRLGIVQTVFWQIAATRFLSSTQLFKPVAYLIGGVVDLTTTAALGVVFIYALHFTGRDYAWYKGAGFGLIVWVGLFGTVLAEATQRKLPADAMTIIVTAIAHLIFGLSLAFFSKRIYKPRQLDRGSA